MQLSRNFTYEEMIASQESARRGIDNTPSPSIFANLKSTCQQAEAVRTLLDHPMLVSSGYRCPALNAAIGGAPTSAHVQGWAMDFICPQVGAPLEICKRIRAAGIKLDQCIQEGHWVHLSFDPRYRGEFLTATFGDAGTIYSHGLEGVT